MFRPVSIDVARSRGTVAVGRDQERECKSEDRIPEEEAGQAEGEDQAEHGHDAGEELEAEKPKEPEQAEHESNENRDQRDHDEQQEEPEEPAQTPAGRSQRAASDRAFGDGHEARGQPQREEADEHDRQEVANRVADQVWRPVERGLRLPDLDIITPADLPSPRVGPGRAGNAARHVPRDGHLTAGHDQVLADRAACRELDLTAGEDPVFADRPGHDDLSAGCSDVTCHRATDSDRAAGSEDVALHGAVQGGRATGHDEVTLDRAVDRDRAGGHVEVGRDRLSGGHADVAAAAQLATEVALGHRDRDREECEEDGDGCREDKPFPTAWTAHRRIGHPLIVAAHRLIVARGQRPCCNALARSGRARPFASRERPHR